jgi:hypothetical protein
MEMTHGEFRSGFFTADSQAPSDVRRIETVEVVKPNIEDNVFICIQK